MPDGPVCKSVTNRSNAASSARAVRLPHNTRSSPCSSAHASISDCQPGGSQYMHSTAKRSNKCATAAVTSARGMRWSWNLAGFQIVGYPSQTGSER